MTDHNQPLYRIFNSRGSAMDLEKLPKLDDEVMSESSTEMKNALPEEILEAINAPVKEFPHFKKFPTELRLKIWECSCNEPRDIVFTLTKDLELAILPRRLRAAPAALHTVSESREVAKRFFKPVMHLDGFLDDFNSRAGVSVNKKPIFFNFSVDTIHFTGSQSMKIAYDGRLFVQEELEHQVGYFKNIIWHGILALNERFRSFSSSELFIGQLKRLANIETILISSQYRNQEGLQHLMKVLNQEHFFPTVTLVDQQELRKRTEKAAGEDISFEYSMAVNGGLANLTTRTMT